MTARIVVPRHTHAALTHGLIEPDGGGWVCVSREAVTEEHVCDWCGGVGSVRNIPSGLPYRCMACGGPGVVRVPVVPSAGTPVLLVADNTPLPETVDGWTVGPLSWESGIWLTKMNPGVPPGCVESNIRLPEPGATAPMTIDAVGPVARWGVEGAPHPDDTDVHMCIELNDSLTWFDGVGDSEHIGRDPWPWSSWEPGDHAIHLTPNP